MPCCSHGTSTALRMNDRLRSAGDVHDRRRADAACAARVIQVAAEPSCRLMRELARRWPGCSDFHRRTRLNRSASVETIAWPSPDVENTTFQDGYGVAHASRDRAPVREARGTNPGKLSALGAPCQRQPVAVRSHSHTNGAAWACSRGSRGM